MNLQPVPLAACGPLTFRCCRCYQRVNQSVLPVYADLDGTPFVDYYCTTCKELTAREAGLEVA